MTSFAFAGLMLCEHAITENLVLLRLHLLLLDQFFATGARTGGLYASSSASSPRVVNNLEQEAIAA